MQPRDPGIFHAPAYTRAWVISIQVGAAVGLQTVDAIVAAHPRHKWSHGFKLTSLSPDGDFLFYKILYLLVYSNY